MSEVFASGRIVDLILVLVVLEGGAIAAYHHRTGHGPALLDILGNLLAGAGLLLALRAALTGAWWGWIALCLFAALLAHMIDLWRRWHG